MSAVRVDSDQKPGTITVRSPRMLVRRDHPEQPAESNGRVAATRRTGPESVVVYRVSAGGHQQTGVVLETAIADYRRGLIRRHEAVDPARERALTEHTENSGTQQAPVVLTHPPRQSLRETITAITGAEPDVRFEPVPGEVHSVWIAEEPALAHAVREEVGSLSALYIADGHHRMAAAARYASRRGGLDAEHPASFTLCALFPSDEMRLFGYPRITPRPAEMTTATLLENLGTAAGSAGLESCTPSGVTPPLPGAVALTMEGDWYRLWLRAPRTGARAALDVVALDEGILTPLFGTRGETIAPPQSGTAFAEWCAEHDMIGFLPHPPSVHQVMAISDAGRVMPAKSTWFDPKAPVGLFTRELA